MSNFAHNIIVVNLQKGVKMFGRKTKASKESATVNTAKKEQSSNMTSGSKSTKSEASAKSSSSKACGGKKSCCKATSSSSDKSSNKSKALCFVVVVDMSRIILQLFWSLPARAMKQVWNLIPLRERITSN